jgi:hypothetical protein
MQSSFPATVFKRNYVQEFEVTANKEKKKKLEISEFSANKGRKKSGHI